MWGASLLMTFHGLRARSLLLPWNSNRLPCQSFVPGRVTTLRSDPAAYPLSAVWPLVVIFNCWMDSDGVTRMAVPLNSSRLVTPSRFWILDVCPLVAHSRWRSGSTDFG